VSTYLPFIVIGLTAGSVYGLAGTGLVLTYKTSGIFNFAHGSVATISAFIFFFLYSQHGWPWPIAGFVSVFVAGPIMGLLLELMARVLAETSHVFKIAATIGVVIIVLAIGDLWYGQTNDVNGFPQFLPQETIRFLGVNVGWDQIIVILISLASTGALYYFFRVFRSGMAMRAVVDDASLMAMTGENPVAVRRRAWVIGATFAALSGVLLAPSLSLNGLVLTMLVVQAFGAAAIGYFSSLPLTFAGGLVIGVVGSLSTKYVALVPALAGLPAGLPFIILFLVLVLTPRARLAARRYVPNIKMADPYYAPGRVRIGFGACFVAFLAVVPIFAGAKLSVFSEGLISVILLLSLGLLIRVSGQVSLCQYGFAAVGAAAMSHLAFNAGVPWLISILLASLTAIPIGAIIAIPAIRLSGVFLALATFGFGILLEQMFYSENFMFGPSTAGAPVPRPDVSILGWNMATDRGFYYLILVFTVLCAIAVVAIMRSRLGRLLVAMSDRPLALETLGTTVNVSRVLVFCISAFMAALSGALLGSLFSFAVGTDFPSFSSLTLVALIVIIPLGAPWYAVMGAAGLQVIPAYINLAHISDYFQILFGVSACLAPLTLARNPGAPAAVRRLAERLDRVLPRREPKAAPLATVSHASRGDGLEIRSLTVSYGGVVAVSDLSLSAPTGKITGLIGPNGAGKTTTFNAACGLVKPNSGQIIVHGRDITRLAPAARARAGVGRTFQRVELFDSLTVGENVDLGREAMFAGGNPLTQLAGNRRDMAVVRAAAAEALELTGLSSVADRRVSELTTGQRRLVELARVVAGPFDMILLDEPSAGLDAAETRHFGTILMTLVQSRGCGLLVVEHDMALVRQICDRVWVLDFGRLVFEGTTEEMLESDIVRAAYLGSGPELESEATETASQVPSPTGAT
jgi:ABC-type branched-subunit amino acid transport system ATPase component/branched-subunit amino acid ABC-type transport system permease component